MKVVDVNVLLYAVNEDAPNHNPAGAWLDTALNGTEAVGFAWVVLLAFLRLATRADLFARPLRVEDSVEVVEAWLSQPPAVILHPTPRHLGVLHGLLAPVGTAANLVNDAHLAALALEHGGGIVSFDRDFTRFPGLPWETPAEA